MKKLIAISLLLTAAFASAQNRGFFEPRTGVPTDSIRLSDPAILADSATMTYYMSGTGGLLWTSKDLKTWDGPAIVAHTDGLSWTGEHPAIWAAELHNIDGKYCYIATFTKRNSSIGINKRGMNLERRASHILFSDNPAGPYYPAGDDTYLPDSLLTLDATFWRDLDGKPYLVYCNEWLQNDDGTIEYVELKPDLSGTVGPATIMFRASDSPWSREIVDGKEGPNRVTDGPWLFRTETGRLGCIWTSWIYKTYTQGVAYSESGTLAGPWVQAPDPITPPNYGHGMIFQDLQGNWWLSCHSHEELPSGRYHRVPHLFPVDLSTDTLLVSPSPI